MDSKIIECFYCGGKNVERLGTGRELKHTLSLRARSEVGDQDEVYQCLRRDECGGKFGVTRVRTFDLEEGKISADAKKLLV